MVEKIKKTPQKQPVSGARAGALALLHQLFQHPEEGTPLPVMLARHVQEAGLGRQDAAFLSELVYGVLRHAALLDAALAGYLKKPGALSAQVRMLLRLGTYEILFMGGIPARATVNELVNLARRRFGQGLGGLVNGVLRSVDRDAEALRLAAEEKRRRLERAEADAEGMAEAASLPLWMAEMWVAQYGGKEACRMACNTLSHPAPCWRVNMARAWGEMLVGHWLERGYAPVGQGGFSAWGLAKDREHASVEQTLLENFERRGDMTRIFAEAGIPMPRSWMVRTDGTLPDADCPCWLKRTDECAQASGDVVYAHGRDELAAAMRRFADRGLREAVVCEHLPGDLVKFYGVKGTGFFEYYYPTAGDGFSKFGLERHNGAARFYAFDAAALAATADRAASLLNLPVYGGDCIVGADGGVRLIDFNDWPSFSRCCDRAAEAITSVIVKAIESNQKQS